MIRGKDFVLMSIVVILLVAVGVVVGITQENNRVYEHCLELHSEKMYSVAVDLCREITQ